MSGQPVGMAIVSGQPVGVATVSGQSVGMATQSVMWCVVDFLNYHNLQQVIGTLRTH